MTEHGGVWNKTKETSENVWNDAKHITEDAWQSTKHAAGDLKEKLSRHHRKMRDEIEFAETDFYEDNIYDEPEYWHGSSVEKRSKFKH